jgi:MFS family permease
MRGRRVTTPGAEGAAPRIAAPSGRVVVITTLGVTQILAWGSSYYLLAVLADVIAKDTGWSLAWVVGALSLGLLVEGLVSPYVGDAIEKYGGRPILATSAILLAAGLAGLAAAPGLPFYVAAWIVVGLGMGTGLYDATFSTLGRLYGLEARQAITLLTLFGGFASTICWPLTAWLSSGFGWRGACLIYASIQVAIALPAYWFLIPREEVRGAASRNKERLSASSAGSHDRRSLFLLLATSFAITTAIASVVSVHLLTLLTARDISLATAVALGTLIGPAQVGARVVELFFGRRHHPFWTMVASSLLIAAGVVLLWIDLPVASLAILLYGAGMGIKSIVRGTVPLVVFGVDGYASLMGRLAMPSLIAGAASPFLGAVMIERHGADVTLGLLTAAAAINLVIVGGLAAAFRASRA